MEVVDYKDAPYLKFFSYVPLLSHLTYIGTWIILSNWNIKAPTQTKKIKLPCMLYIMYRVFSKIVICPQNKAARHDIDVHTLTTRETRVWIIS